MSHVIYSHIKLLDMIHLCRLWTRGNSHFIPNGVQFKDHLAARGATSFTRRFQGDQSGTLKPSVIVKVLYVTGLHVAERSHLCFVKPHGDVDYTALFLLFKISASGGSSQERSDPGCWAFDCCVMTPNECVRR